MSSTLANAAYFFLSVRQSMISVNSSFLCLSVALSAHLTVHLIFGRFLVRSCWFFQSMVACLRFGPFVSHGLQLNFVESGEFLWVVF